jgi:hypothetical protein
MRAPCVSHPKLLPWFDSWVGAHVAPPSVEVARKALTTSPEFWPVDVFPGGLVGAYAGSSRES